MIAVSENIERIYKECSEGKTSIQTELYMLENMLDTAYLSEEILTEDDDLYGGYGHDLACLQAQIKRDEAQAHTLQGCLDLRKPVDMCVYDDYCQCWHDRNSQS